MGESRAVSKKNWRLKVAGLGADGLLPYQRQFLSAVCRRDNRVELAGLSIGRGNGKTHLCGEMLARALKPSDDPLYVEGAESVLVSASRPMAALTLEAARKVLANDPEFRWRADGVIHVGTRTRCRVLSSDSRRAYGLGSDLNLAVLDEPGSFLPTGGEKLWQALLGSLGKNSTARILACGTLAPGPVGGWWEQFIAGGSGPGKHIQLIQGSESTWRDWDSVAAANPVCAISKSMVRTLRREHDEALKSDRAAGNFLRFRMNINKPESLASQPVLTPEELSRVYSRQVPERSGQPVVGVDLGGGRSFSACAAVWPNGRIEVWCLAAGDVSLEEAARLDQLPEDVYTSLAQSGGLAVDSDRAVPSPEKLLAQIWAWNPQCVVADGFRASELRTAIAGRCPLVERGRGSSETASHVQAMRSAMLDGLAGVTESSRALLAFGFEQSAMTIGNDGVTRVVKLRGKRSREDSVAALLLASGHAARRPAPVELRAAVVSRTGQVRWL